MELPFRRRRRLGRRALESRLAKTERELEKERRSEAKASARIVPLQYEHADIRLDGSTKAAGKRRTAARKEPFTVEWLHSLPAGEVLYDIGANVGAYSLIAALRPQGPLRVIAFEPGAATFAVLCSNIVLNDAGEHITPLPVTLGERTELGRFGYSDLQAGAALHVGGGEVVPGEVVYWQPVLVFALDELVERFGLPRPQQIKLDVDGAELNVLRGAGRTLSDPGLRSVLMEFDARGQTAVDELLAGHGLHRVETYREPEAGEGAAYARFERR
jgi:FkbM family methyltransferase